MTKVDLAKEMARKSGADYKECLKMIDVFTETVKENVTKTSTVYLRGFGTFLTKHRKQKVGRNIGKGTSVVIPATWKPVFKPSQYFNN